MHAHLLQNDLQTQRLCSETIGFNIPEVHTHTRTQAWSSLALWKDSVKLQKQNDWAQGQRSSSPVRMCAAVLRSWDDDNPGGGASICCGPKDSLFIQNYYVTRQRAKGKVFSVWATAHASVVKVSCRCAVQYNKSFTLSFNLIFGMQQLRVWPAGLLLETNMVCLL